MTESREHLICAAVAFLHSPEVRDHPDDAKRTFLKNKNLTENEIRAAFARSRMVKPSEPVTKEEFNKQFEMKIDSEGHARNRPVPVRPKPPFLLVAFGAGVVGSVVYYLFKAFRKYIWPWILRKWSEFRAKKPPEGVFSGGVTKADSVGMTCEGGELRELVTCSMLELQDTVTSLKSILDKQQEDMKAIVSKFHLQDPISTEMRDVKGELENLKKILLSGSQFSAPLSTGNIPEWQIRKTVQSTSAAVTQKPASQSHKTTPSGEPNTPPNGSSEPNTPPNGSSEPNTPPNGSIEPSTPPNGPSEPNTPPRGGTDPPPVSTHQSSNSDISIVNWEDSSTSTDASPHNTILESGENSSSSSNSHSPIEIISQHTSLLSKDNKNDSLLILPHSSEEEDEEEEEEPRLKEEEDERRSEEEPRLEDMDNKVLYSQCVTGSGSSPE